MPLNIDDTVTCHAKTILPEIIWNTLALDKNPATREQVDIILQGKSPSGFSKIKLYEVIYLANAFIYMINKVEQEEFSLTMNTICGIHHAIELDITCGRGLLRTGEYFISDDYAYTPPTAANLQNLLELGITELHTIHDPYEQAFMRFYLFANYARFGTTTYRLR